MDQDFREHVNYLSGNMLDRAAHLRTNLKWLRSAITQASTRFMILRRLEPLCKQPIECANISSSFETRNELAGAWNKYVRDRSRLTVEGKVGPRALSLARYSDVEDLLKPSGLASSDETTEGADILWPLGLLFVGLEKNLLETSANDHDASNDPAWFAMDVTKFASPLVERFEEKALSRSEYLPARTAAFALEPSHSSVYSQARSVLAWQERYRFCASCGEAMALHEAGYKGTCLKSACISNQGVHNTCYPRTDPTVIMCVYSSDGRRCLLGRRSAYPPGTFSCLSGFVEPGESAEDAVIRETFEESGIAVDCIRYHSSQPWPFPSSLMLGFIAKATSEKITVCTDELEDVRWFDRDEVSLAVRGESKTLFIPPKETIAHQLLKFWTSIPISSNL